MSERILACLLVVIAILAAIPQAMFLPWGTVLVFLGLVAGAMAKPSDAADRIVIYVAAIALPIFSDSLDVIPTVGPWVNQVLDHLATGIQGMAVAIFVVVICGKIIRRTK